MWASDWIIYGALGRITEHESQGVLHFRGAGNEMPGRDAADGIYALGH